MKRAFIILLLVCGVAHADDKATAERYFRAGAKAYAAQNFAAAATNFDEAYKALPMPEIAFSAAQAYRRLYQIEPKPAYVRRAVELYQTYLGAVKKGGRVGDAADNLAEMKHELDKLQAAGASFAVAPAKPQTRLGINVNLGTESTLSTSIELTTLTTLTPSPGDAVPGLAVTIDGTKVEPFTLVEVQAKEHVVTVSADGYFPVEKKTVAVDGQSTLVDVELKAKPAKLAVNTESDARISIDGRYVATAPAAALELAAGKHYMTVLRSGREPFAKELTVARGQELAVAAPLHKTTKRKIAPCLLGGAGLLLGGAITTGIFAWSRDNRASDLHAQIEMGNQMPSTGDAYDQAVADRDRFRTYTWILGGAAATTGLVGGLMLYLDTPTADSATVGVSGHF